MDFKDFEKARMALEKATTEEVRYCNVCRERITDFSRIHGCFQERNGET